MEIFGMGYNEVIKLPVYLRKFFIGLKVKQKEAEQDYLEKNNGTKKGGKTTYSGDTLKSKLNNNEILS